VADTIDILPRKMDNIQPEGTDFDLLDTNVWLAMLMLFVALIPVPPETDTNTGGERPKRGLADTDEGDKRARVESPPTAHAITPVDEATAAALSSLGVNMFDQVLQ
jgi:hypothetical protein